MTTATKSDVVRARIETRVKKHAEGILKRLGVSHSTFINMSYRAVVEEGGIPFSLHVPNRETARVLRDARKSAKRGKYTKVANLEEFAVSLRAPSKR
jgi:DNA-damage-inducible protein J